MTEITVMELHLSLWKCKKKKKTLSVESVTVESSRTKTDFFDSQEDMRDKNGQVSLALASNDTNKIGKKKLSRSNE